MNYRRVSVDVRAYTHVVAVFRMKAKIHFTIFTQLDDGNRTAVASDKQIERSVQLYFNRHEIVRQARARPRRIRSMRRYNGAPLVQVRRKPDVCRTKFEKGRAVVITAASRPRQEVPRYFIARAIIGEDFCTFAHKRCSNGARLECRNLKTGLTDRVRL